MQSLALSLLPVRLARLRHFQLFYLLPALRCSGLTLAIIAWPGQQPGDKHNDLPYRLSIPRLGLASVLINALSFYFQNRDTRTLLQRPGLADACPHPLWDALLPQGVQRQTRVV